MLFFLLGTGVLFTFKLRFLQVTKLGMAFKQIFKTDEVEGDAEGMSPFQSLSTAIAAQVGTGNLAGVATAIAAGGPGSIFWMWISGFFGMGTIFGEANKKSLLDTSETILNFCKQETITFDQLHSKLYDLLNLDEVLATHMLNRSVIRAHVQYLESKGYLQFVTNKGELLIQRK
jgi:hypothetical protein